MRCSKCQSDHNVKTGTVRGLQRYKCKVCGNNFTIDYDQVVEKEKKRRFGLAMYLEGLGFHSIGRLLNVSRRFSNESG
jgi:transposase-like protein